MEPGVAFLAEVGGEPWPLANHIVLMKDVGRAGGAPRVLTTALLQPRAAQTLQPSSLDPRVVQPVLTGKSAPLAKWLLAIGLNQT